MLEKITNMREERSVLTSQLQNSTLHGTYRKVACKPQHCRFEMLAGSSQKHTEATCRRLYFISCRSRPKSVMVCMQDDHKQEIKLSR